MDWQALLSLPSACYYIYAVLIVRFTMVCVCWFWYHAYMLCVGVSMYCTNVCDDNAQATNVSFRLVFFVVLLASECKFARAFRLIFAIAAHARVAEGAPQNRIARRSC